jgi:hypothetical protein
MLVRLPEIMLILLSLAIIVLAGFGPLFGSGDPHGRIREECQMFYGFGGQGEIAHCVAEMTQRSAASPP